MLTSSVSFVTVTFEASPTKKCRMAPGETTDTLDPLRVTPWAPIISIAGTPLPVPAIAQLVIVDVLSVENVKPCARRGDRITSALQGNVVGGDGHARYTLHGVDEVRRECIPTWCGDRTRRT